MRSQKRNADYKILPGFRLVLECCRGQASVDDAIYMKKAELSDKLYNPDYNIFVDFRDFETILNSTLNESTLHFFYFLKDLNIQSKIAILTAAPHQVVISLILKELSASSRSFKMEVFSTIEAALSFLGIPDENFGIIGDKILELNKTTA